MRNIQFISYDGAYPNLCSGTLVLSVDGQEVAAMDCLYPGGEACVDKDGDEYISEGPWKVKWDKFSIPFTFHEMAHITKLVNQYVEHSCCGGCI